MTHSLHFLFGLSSCHQVVFTRQTPARWLTAMLTPMKTAAVWAAVSTVLAQVGTATVRTRSGASGRSDDGPVPDMWFANASAGLSRSRRQAYGPANGYHPCTESTGGVVLGMRVLVQRVRRDIALLLSSRANLLARLLTHTSEKVKRVAEGDSATSHSLDSIPSPHQLTHAFCWCAPVSTRSEVEPIQGGLTHKKRGCRKK